MVVTQRSFVRYDLAISRKLHAQNVMDNVYPILDKDIDPDLKIKLEDVPTFKDLKALLEKVGKPYGWDRRAEYWDKDSVQEISEKLAKPSSRRYSFWSGNKEVGGVIIANIEPDLAKIFKKAREGNPHLDLDARTAQKTIEIYKIGLLPEYTGKGWGKHFVAQTLTQLFDSECRYEAVYLNTRDTNHSGVVRFYRGLNMNVINAMTHPDDLLTPEEIEKRLKKKPFKGLLGTPDMPTPEAAVA